MEELTNLSATGEEQVNNDTESTFMSTIKDIKNNSVSRESYAKLEEQLAQSDKEKAELLKMIFDGSESKVKNQEQKKLMSDEEYYALRKRACHGDQVLLSSLDRAKDMLAYREEYYKRHGEDVFTSPFQNEEYDDTQDGIDLATLLTHCVEYADGDDEAYRNELSRLLVDPVLPRQKKKASR